MKIVYLVPVALGFGFTFNASVTAEMNAEIGVVSAHIGESGGALVHRGNAAFEIETGSMLQQNDIVTTGPDSSVVIKTSGCVITVNRNAYLELDSASLCATFDFSTNRPNQSVDLSPSNPKTTDILDFNLQDASKSNAKRTRAVGSS